MEFSQRQFDVRHQLLNGGYYLLTINYFYGTSADECIQTVSYGIPLSTNSDQELTTKEIAGNVQSVTSPLKPFPQLLRVPPSP